MLEANLVYAMLGASITGATLVLILYTIAIPFSEKILLERAKEEKELIKKVLQLILKAQAKNIETARESTSIPEAKNLLEKEIVLSQEEIEECNIAIEKLKEHERIPLYLKTSSGYIIFVGYVASALMSLWWAIDYHKDFMDKYLPWAFGIATLVFLFTGIYLIQDVTKNISGEYQNILDKLKDN